MFLVNRKRSEVSRGYNRPKHAGRAATLDRALVRGRVNISNDEKSKRYLGTDTSKQRSQDA